MELKSMLAAELASVEIGAIQKREAVDEIEQYISKHYIPTGMERMPAIWLDAIHRMCGVEFPAADGRVLGMESEG